MTILKTICDEHLLYRKQILRLAKSDLVKTYRGSALGWSWAFIKPMVTIFVYWFAFSYGIRSGGDVDGYPFFFMAYSRFCSLVLHERDDNSGSGVHAEQQTFNYEDEVSHFCNPNLYKFIKADNTSYPHGGHHRHLHRFWAYAG